MHEEIKKALEVIHNGGIILYPTDTIWGIGCDANNEKAVQKIYDIKKRADAKSMILLIDLPQRIASYVEEIPDVAWDLIDFSTKPLTIIYSGAKNLAKNVIAEDGSVGIRVAQDEFCQKLISRVKKPIVSTSANISGEQSPKNFDSISDEIKKAVDYIVDWRQEETKNPPASSIIKLGLNGEVKIIRE
jgi:L-threonylcarbamoyladenylate synthase